MVFDAVLFDFGGVYTASPFGAFEAYATEIGAPAEQVLAIVFGPYDRDTDHPWHRLERGEIPFVEAREAIMGEAAAQSIEIDPLQVLVRMTGSDGPREALVTRTRALRAAGYRTALVTNNAREFREAWRPVLPLEELFDSVVDSSEEGVRKPDAAIYHLALARIGGVAPERAVFVDDFPGNVEAARSLGMHGIHVADDPTAAIAELDRILARPPGL
jgi:epoxide hydrolase-like predicted phosphatase